MGKKLRPLAKENVPTPWYHGVNYGHGEKDPLKLEKTWGNNVVSKPLNSKYKIIFKFKRNSVKLIND
jgi:hypothetical protein